MAEMGIKCLISILTILSVILYFSYRYVEKTVKNPANLEEALKI